MLFSEARLFLMPMGKHKGKTLDAIAQNDKGLKYLDWLIGQDWVYGRTKAALESYLNEPAIARGLKSLLSD
jgi:hypothetical protein